MCPAVGVSLQELAIGAASRSTVARFLIDARRRDGVMTQCVGRLGLKQLPMPVDVPTSRLLALSYRLVDGSQTIQACRSAAQGFERLNPNGYFKFKEGRLNSQFTLVQQFTQVLVVTIEEYGKPKVGRRRKPAATPATVF